MRSALLIILVVMLVGVWATTGVSGASSDLTHPHFSSSVLSSLLDESDVSQPLLMEQHAHADTEAEADAQADAHADADADAQLDSELDTSATSELDASSDNENELESENESDNENNVGPMIALELDTQLEDFQGPAGVVAPAPDADNLASVSRVQDVRSQLTDAVRTLARQNPERSETIRVEGNGDISKRIPNAARFKKVHVHLHHAKPKQFDNRRLNAMVQRLQKQHHQASVKIAEILYRLKKCAGKKTCLPFIKEEMSQWKKDWIKETQAVSEL